MWYFFSNESIRSPMHTRRKLLHNFSVSNFHLFMNMSICITLNPVFIRSTPACLGWQLLRTVGNVLPVTRWLILSSAYKSWQSMMVSHRAVDQLHSWDSWVSTVQLIDCSMGYYNGLSELICRAFSQPPSYKETSSFREMHIDFIQFFQRPHCIRLVSRVEAFS